MLFSYYAARAHLSTLSQAHPEWSHRQLASALGASLSWVEKWSRRFRLDAAAGVALEDTLQGHSRVRHTPSACTPDLVVETILLIRDQPPDHLRRIPGPKAIQYFLSQEPLLKLFGYSVPSGRTIARILDKNDRIIRPAKPFHNPVERPAPLSCWQIDFKDVSSVPAEPEGKQQHTVETLNILDVGTSVLLQAHVRPDFTAETALLALAETLRIYGCPRQITLDRDTRWVGSPQGSDFPSALLRFGACLGIEIHVCDPRHPQENGFVERYNRSYQQECLSLDRPTTLEQARETTDAFVFHYNVERPHQGLSCGNLPPRTAFPVLPSLPPLPTQVDPDSWLTTLEKQQLVRKVDPKGMVSIDLKRYYVDIKLAGQRVAIQLDAQEHCAHIRLEQRYIKAVALRGLVNRTLSFEEFLQHMQHQARAQSRLRTLQQRRYRMK